MLPGASEILLLLSTPIGAETWKEFQRGNSIRCLFRAKLPRSSAECNVRPIRGLVASNRFLSLLVPQLVTQIGKVMGHGGDGPLLEEMHP